MPSRAKVGAVILLLIVGTIAPGVADTGDLSSVIEGFVAKHFPSAEKHFWVVNAAQWQTETELVVDLNTVTLERASQQTAENRFLLLIVAGKLAAAQNIPLNAETDCQPERA